MTPDEAREQTDAISQVMTGGWRIIAGLIRQGAPKALGLSVTDWGKQIEGRVVLELEERQAAVAELTKEGMSTRQIATAVGTSNQTVIRDQREAGLKTQPAPYVPPESEQRASPQVKPIPEPQPAPYVPPEPRWQTSADIRLGDYREVLPADLTIDLIFTSPPYNIGSKQPRQDGARKMGFYDGKSYGAITDYPDDLPEDEYQDQQAQFLIWCADHLAEDGILAYNHKPRRRGRMIHPAEWFLRPEVFLRLTLMEEIIWDRGSTHNHGRQLMWPQTERIYIFRRASDNYMLDNTASLPQQSDVWRISRAPSNGHNAPFPMELAQAVIAAWSHPANLVCDPYMGSGTTAEAALSLGRYFIGAEILPEYFEQAQERLSAAA